MTLEFFVAGQPRGKQRPRFWNGRAVTPKETREYEEHIAWAAKAAGAKPHKLPCKVFITAGFEIPASWSMKKKNAALNGMPHISRPDGDNISKITLDGLNGVAWHDDSQVYHLCVTKKYVNEPGLFVQVVYDHAE